MNPSRWPTKIWGIFWNDCLYTIKSSSHPLLLLSRTSLLVSKPASNFNSKSWWLGETLKLNRIFCSSSRYMKLPGATIEVCHLWMIDDKMLVDILEDLHVNCCFYKFHLSCTTTAFAGQASATYHGWHCLGFEFGNPALDWCVWGFPSKRSKSGWSFQAKSGPFWGKKLRRGIRSLTKTPLHSWSNGFSFRDVRLCTSPKPHPKYVFGTTLQVGNNRKNQMETWIGMLLLPTWSRFVSRQVLRKSSLLFISFCSNFTFGTWRSNFFKETPKNTERLWEMSNELFHKIPPLKVKCVTNSRAFLTWREWRTPDGFLEREKPHGIHDLNPEALMLKFYRCGGRWCFSANELGVRGGFYGSKNRSDDL